MWLCHRKLLASACAACVTFTTASAQQDVSAGSAAIPAEKLQSRAVGRLSALAEYLEREAKQATIDFSKFTKSYPGGEYPMIVHTTIMDLNKSDSSVTRNVLSTPTVADYTKALERDPEVAVKDPDLVRGKLFGAASVEVGRYKGYADTLRTLASSVATAPAEKAVDLINQTTLPADILALLGAAETPTRDLGATPPGPPAGAQASLAYFATGSGRVVGRAKPTIDYPAVAAIMQDSGDQVLRTSCTGTLVAPNVVLSAAHCFCEFDEDQKFLESAPACRGATFRRRNGSRVRALDPGYRRVYFQHAGLRRIAKIEIPDDFSFPHADLAVLVLEEAVVGIKPAPIAVAGSVRAGEIAEIVGFGRHSRLDVAGRPLSLKAEDYEVGLKFAAKTRIGTCKDEDVPRKLICWSYEPHRTASLALQGNTCNGDSGGPLFVTRNQRTELVGVTSGGIDRDCGPNDYSFDVDVASFKDWISDRVSTNSPRTLTTVPISSLAPHTNDYQYYVLWKEWLRFDYSQPIWEGAFTVPAAMSILRFGVNSHELSSSRPLRIQLWTPTGKLACDVKTDSNVLMCPRIDKPAVGGWRFRLEGPGGLDFQSVATAFAKL